MVGPPNRATICSGLCGGPLYVVACLGGHDYCLETVSGCYVLNQLDTSTVGYYHV